MCFILYFVYDHIVINVNAPEGPGLVKLNEIKKNKYVKEEDVINSTRLSIGNYRHIIQTLTI